MFKTQLSENEIWALKRLLASKDDLILLEGIKFLDKIIPNNPFDYRAMPRCLRQLTRYDITTDNMQLESAIVSDVLEKWDWQNEAYLDLNISCCKEDRAIDPVAFDFFVEEVKDFYVDESYWRFFPTIEECAKLISLISNRMPQLKGQQLFCSTVLVQTLAGVQKTLLGI